MRLPATLAHPLILAATTKSSSSGNILLLLVVVAAVVLFMGFRRSGASRRAALQRQQESLEIGREVLLRAGIYARVRGFDGDALLLETSPGVVVKAVRGSIMEVLPVPPSEPTMDAPPVGAAGEPFSQSGEVGPASGADEPQPAEPVPDEPQPSEPQPSALQPREPQPDENQPGEPQPGEEQTSELQPGEPEPAEPPADEAPADDEKVGAKPTPAAARRGRGG